MPRHGRAIAQQLSLPCALTSGILFLREEKDLEFNSRKYQAPVSGARPLNCDGEGTRNRQISQKNGRGLACGVVSASKFTRQLTPPIGRGGGGGHREKEVFRDAGGSSLAEASPDVSEAGTRSTCPHSNSGCRSQHLRILSCVPLAPGNLTMTLRQSINVPTSVCCNTLVIPLITGAYPVSFYAVIGN